MKSLIFFVQAAAAAAADYIESCIYCAHALSLYAMTTSKYTSIAMSKLVV